MQNITIHRYNDPAKVGWFGSVEPEDRSWILFIPVDDGPPSVFVKRDIDTGAVYVDEETAKIIDDAE